MARKKPAAETLDDLLAPHLREGHRLTAWAALHGLNPRTIYRLRLGEGKPHLATLALLAGVLKVDVARLRAAIAASKVARK